MEFKFRVKVYTRILKLLNQGHQPSKSFTSVRTLRNITVVDSMTLNKSSRYIIFIKFVIALIKFQHDYARLHMVRP